MKKSLKLLSGLGRLITFRDIAVFLALSSWIFGLIAVFFWWALSFALFPFFPITCAVSVSILAALLAAPLEIPPPHFITRFLSFTITSGYRYFPVKVVYEDKDALHSGRPYIIGYEPHSVLPQGICAFCEHAPPGSLPPGLSRVRILVSSAGFWAPVMRHLWWWLGCRPASRAVMKALLNKGTTVALCPGGVRECIYMRAGTEVAYLKRRQGFVRLALQHGVPLVPVFAFGQSNLYGYIRLFFDFPRGVVPRSAWARFTRRIGFVPMFVWGRWGTAIPRREPLIIVVGAPIEVPHTPEPSMELVEEYLGKFIHALEALFEKHKKAAGYPMDEKLTVH